MTYSGHIEHGHIVLDQPVKLVEGTRVQVEVLDAEHPHHATPSGAPRVPGQFAGQIWLSPSFDTWPEEFHEAWGLTS